MLVEAAPTMVWRSGLDGKCDYFNETWLAFTGRTLREELGDGWTEGVHPEDLERCVSLYRERFGERRAFEMEYRLRRHDGVYRWIFDRGVPFHDERGAFAGFIGSCVDVHERRIADEAKSMFLSMMAHELRTPVQALVLYGHELDRAARAQGALPAAVAQRMRRRIDRLRTLVEHAATGVDASMGRAPELELEEVDAASLVADAIRMQQEAGRGRRKGAAAIRLRHGGGRVPVRADPARLAQALDIVLDNALKYSPHGGTIEVGIDAGPDEVRITVDDEGIGIPEGDLARVGTPFFRAANAPAQEYAGMGIGLAIAIEVVRAHGGRLQVSPRAPRGTRVLLALPARAAS